MRVNVARAETSDGDTKLEVNFETTYKELKVLVIGMTSLATAWIAGLKQHLGY